VVQDGNAMQYAAEELRADRDIVLTAVRQMVTPCSTQQRQLCEYTGTVAVGETWIRHPQAAAWQAGLFAQVL
jgi:hypothetical protein